MAKSPLRPRRLTRPPPQILPLATTQTRPPTINNWKEASRGEIKAQLTLSHGER